MDITTNQEEQIFLAALELAPDAHRDEFLSKRCHGDEQLLSRVKELLELHQQSDNILDDTSGGFLQQSVGAADSLGVGCQIGPYKLLQEIGVGGMGVVYMAEQSQPVRRKVAVKIIKLGMDTRNVIARFEAERQALAMMDHPNITKVFDAGATSSGRPYFVMELVTGLAITDYCDREKLSLRDRIELFHQVCIGIKHAHQKGIIHRDLKPSNVMVTHYDGVPVPKIIDFGIAKAVDQTLTEKTLFTSYGNMIGTPEYMSPEQAEMSGQDIDTRTDVYSLGVLMYELLTGTTPFHHWRKKGIHKFCEAICHEEPELASTRVNNLADTVDDISRNRSTDSRSLRRTLKGDMDWILAKCLSKKRSERYESAADLARDVQNYLNGQPIEAVGPNLSYRARKFANKHRASLAFAAIILLTLISATIVSTVFAFQAIKSNRLASQRLKEADQARRDAVKERDRALAAETKLQEMVAESWRETADTRALARLAQGSANPRDIRVFHPARKSDQETIRVWANADAEATTEARVIAMGNAHKHANHDVDGFDVELTREQSAGNSAPGSQNKMAYRVMFNGDGQILVDRDVLKGGNEFTFEQKNGDVHQVVVIRDKAKTKEYLKMLAEERREKFGPKHELVADAVFEIGNLSLDDQEWSEAENQFREYRDIIEVQADKEAELAKVELLIGKAQMHQKKHALARETLKKGVDRIFRLRKVPVELEHVVEDIKDLEIRLEQTGEELSKELHEEILKKLRFRKVTPRNVEIEVRREN